MTDPTSEAVWLSGFTVLSATEQDTHRVHFLEALSVALEAMKLAIEAAGQAPRRVSYEHPTLPQTFESWAAANLVVNEVFEKLYARTRHAIDIIKPAQD